jgi:hypothetical protein
MSTIATGVGTAGGMPTSTIDEQLTKYLTDAHAIEEQALAQMRVAPRIAGNPQLAEIFRRHLAETEEQEQTVRARLDARGAKPSKVKEAVMAAGGVGFVLFAKSQPTRRASSSPTATPTSTWRSPPTSCSPAWRSGPATRRPPTPRSASVARSRRWPTAWPARSTSPPRPR